MTQPPKILDLFSGIGGFSLGLERAGFETAAFCEIEPFCRKVLQKHWPTTPIAHDIRQLRYANTRLYDADRCLFTGRIHLVCGGFPCQPFSLAGRKKGTADDRDLWPEMFRIIREVKPAIVVGENVAHFTHMAFSRAKIDLENAGYAVQPFIIPACATGAPHRRDRVWIIAYAPGTYGENEGFSQNCGPQQIEPRRGDCGYVSWANGLYQPGICGADDGLPHRVDRVKALGNAVVPALVEVLGRAIHACCFAHCDGTQNQPLLYSQIGNRGKADGNHFLC